MLLAACALVGYSATLQTRWQIALYATLFLMSAALFALHRLTSVIFYLLLFFLPLDLGKSLFNEPAPAAGVGHELKITIAVVLLFILTLFLAVKTVVKRRRFRLFGQITIPALLFMFLSALSIVKAPQPLWSVFELFLMACGFLTYFIVANYIISYRPKFTVVITVLMASLALEAGFGILQHFYEGPLGLTLFGEMEMDSAQWGAEAISRGGGLMGHPNALGALLIMLFPIAALTAVFAEGWKLRLFAIFASVMSVVALLFTYSRSAWIGCLLGTILMAPLGVRRLFGLSSAVNKRRAKGVLLCLGLGLSVAVLMFATLIQDRFEMDDYGSASSRIPMMVDALEAIKHNYLLGVGLNNYPLIVLKYDVTGIHREWQATVVHNIFLLIAAETGPVSLLVFSWLLFQVLRRTTKPVKAGSGVTQGVLVLGAKCGVVSLLVFSTVDPSLHFYPGLQRFFWCLLALITALSELDAGPPLTQADENRTSFGERFNRSVSA